VASGYVMMALVGINNVILAAVGLQALTTASPTALLACLD